MDRNSEITKLKKILMFCGIIILVLIGVAVGMTYKNYSKIYKGNADVDKVATIYAKWFYGEDYIHEYTIKSNEKQRNCDIKELVGLINQAAYKSYFSWIRAEISKWIEDFENRDSLDYGGDFNGYIQLVSGEKIDLEENNSYEWRRFLDTSIGMQRNEN